MYKNCLLFLKNEYNSIRRNYLKRYQYGDQTLYVHHLNVGKNHDK